MDCKMGINFMQSLNEHPKSVLHRHCSANMETRYCNAQSINSHAERHKTCQLSTPNSLSDCLTSAAISQRSPASAPPHSGVGLRLRGDSSLGLLLLLRLPRLPLPRLSLSALWPRSSLPPRAAGDALRLLLRPLAGLTKSSLGPPLPAAGLLWRLLLSSAGGPGSALRGAGLLALPLLRLRLLR
jgi:hypothetical protein